MERNRKRKRKEEPVRGPPIANVLPDRTVSGQHAASPGTSTSRPGPSRRELRTWLKVSLHIWLKGILCRVDGGEGAGGGGGRRRRAPPAFGPWDLGAEPPTRGRPSAVPLCLLPSRCTDAPSIPHSTSDACSPRPAPARPGGGGGASITCVSSMH